MLIATIEQQIMLKGQRRNPHVARGNRSSLRAELSKHTGKVMRGPFIGVKHANSGTIEKTDENTLISAGNCAAQNTGSQFGQCDERHINRLSSNSHFPYQTKKSQTLRPAAQR